MKRLTLRTDDVFQFLETRGFLGDVVGTDIADKGQHFIEGLEKELTTEQQKKLFPILTKSPFSRFPPLITACILLGKDHPFVEEHSQLIAADSALRLAEKPPREALPSHESLRTALVGLSADLDARRLSVPAAAGASFQELVRRTRAAGELRPELCPRDANTFASALAHAEVDTAPLVAELNGHAARAKKECAALLARVERSQAVFGQEKATEEFLAAKWKVLNTGMREFLGEFLRRRLEPLDFAVRIEK
eukprot:gnl/Chilomastix_cuspidata/3251.p2 GENE.gnl/Chilomastix_cuspidata/3251~~gnl/Chilomastix_cuspidata/3251.p2  ORF type:complete len:250 (-),score=72.85 gnl/Chilomastix_cuspidata/3251:52-801(-)